MTEYIEHLASMLDVGKGACALCDAPGCCLALLGLAVDADELEFGGDTADVLGLDEECWLAPLHGLGLPLRS